MEKVIGWLRLLIGLWLFVFGLINLFENGYSGPASLEMVAVLAGAYAVLGSFKHFKKELRK